MAFFHFLLNFLKTIMYVNSEGPDQTRLSAATDLGLHCLPMSHKKDTRLICATCQQHNKEF